MESDGERRIRYLKTDWVSMRPWEEEHLLFARDRYIHVRNIYRNGKSYYSYIQGLIFLDQIFKGDNPPKLTEKETAELMQMVQFDSNEYNTSHDDLLVYAVDLWRGYCYSDTRETMMFDASILYQHVFTRRQFLDADDHMVINLRTVKELFPRAEKMRVEMKYPHVMKMSTDEIDRDIPQDSGAHESVILRASKRQREIKV